MATVSPSPTMIAYLMYATMRQSFQYGLYCVMFCVGKKSNMVGVGGLKMDALQIPDFLSKNVQPSQIAPPHWKKCFGWLCTSSVRF